MKHEDDGDFINTKEASIPFELEILSNAHRYQRWLYDSVAPFLGKRILEIGSGIGNLSQHLPLRERLIFSDVDSQLLQVLADRVRPDFNRSTVVHVDPEVSLDKVFKKESLDTIVSFNVFEHVKDDVALFREALKLLLKNESGDPLRIITLVPAHKFAFGSIDIAFGHFRRYSRRSFKAMVREAASPLDVEITQRSFYLNLPALLGWVLTGRILKRKMIGSNNMDLFEKLCPVIRPVDNFLHKVLRLPLGNSLVSVVEIKRPNKSRIT